MGDRGRTLTRLVGEQAAGDTGADRDDDRCAEEAAARRLGVEGAAEDTAEGFRQVWNVDDQRDQGHQQIGAGHPGDYRFCDPADRLDAADDDNEDGDRSHRAADPFLDAEQFVGAVAEAVRLDAVAGDQRGEERAEAEQDCQPGPFRAEADGDIAHRTATIGAVSGLLAEAHGQRALGKGERHAEQGSDPHPEDGAGAAERDGGGNAGEIAGADLAGQRRRQRGEGRNLALAFVRRFFEQASESGKQAEQRIAAQSDHEIDAGAEQKHHHRRDREDFGAFPGAAPDEIRYIGDRHDRRLKTRSRCCTHKNSPRWRVVAQYSIGGRISRRALFGKCFCQMAASAYAVRQPENRMEQG